MPTIDHIAVKPADRGGSETIERDRVTRSYERTYVLRTTAPATEPEMTSLSHPLLPNLGDIHPQNIFARVTSRRPRAVAGPLVWEMRVEWRTDASDEEEEPNPIDRAPVVTTGSVNYSRPLERDADGAPVTNTVGEPFDPAPETEDMRETIHVSQNVPSVDNGWLGSYRRHVNAGPLIVVTRAQTWQWEDNTLLFHGFSASEESENGVNYLRVTITFQEKPDGWNPRELLNTGYRFLEFFPGVAGITFVPRNVADIAGADLNSPRLLNEDGSLAPLPLPEGFTPHYVRVKEFQKRSFQPLISA